MVRRLVDAGIHFGHRASRWNPKMAPYIFGKRNTIHIIDIRETIKGLLRATKFISQVVARGDDVLFVGTKRQARIHVIEQANRTGMPYVSERWLGGTLTNFRTIRSRLTRLEELETAEADGTALQYSKKMIAQRSRELQKIKRNLDGIRTMNRLPGAVVVVDVQREKNAVREARTLRIPTVCLIDTDSDPDFADVPIPGNDDAMRAIEVVLRHLADAIELAKRARQESKADQGQDDGGQQPRRRSQRATTARADNAAREDKQANPGEPAGAESADGLTPAATTEGEQSS
ncbi:MAG: 30S ribosomal protein S2 [Phycisphaerae bacterium]